MPVCFPEASVLKFRYNVMCRMLADSYFPTLPYCSTAADRITDTAPSIAAAIILKGPNRCESK